MIVFVGNWLAATVAGDFEFRRVTLAPESTRSVVFMFGGLVQLEIENILLLKLSLTFSSHSSFSAGLYHHLAFQF